MLRGSGVLGRPFTANPPSICLTYFNLANDHTHPTHGRTLNIHVTETICNLQTVFKGHIFFFHFSPLESMLYENRVPFFPDLLTVVF